MNNKAPSWWSHSNNAWIEISNYFLNQKTSNQQSIIILENKHSWTTISEGRSNHNYCLSVKESRYFIQITNCSNNIFLPFERKVSLKNILSEKAFKKISPWLIKARFESNEVKIQDWFDSKTLDLDFKKENSNLANLAKALAEIHNVQPENIQHFDLAQHLDKYRKIALSNKKNVKIKTQVLACYDQANNSLKSYKPSALCHYDLNLNNVLFNEKDKKIKIIDWEYVCIGDPMLDVNALSNNLDLCLEKEQFFYQSYFNERAIENDKQRFFDEKKLSDMKILNHCILKLWEFGQ